jgi:hypothetical protein
MATVSRPDDPLIHIVREQRRGLGLHSHALPAKPLRSITTPSARGAFVVAVQGTSACGIFQMRPWARFQTGRFE